MIKIKKLNTVLIIGIAVFALMSISGCDKNDNDETSYVLKAQDVLGVNGTATFIENSGNSVNIDIVLTGAP